MGKNAYTKSIELMKEVRKEGYEKEISAKSLCILLKKIIGGDPRTVEKYIDLLIDFGFIKKIGNGVFEIVEIKKSLY